MTPHDDLTIGQMVEITTGHWRGLQAIITDLLGEDEGYGVVLMTQHGNEGVFEALEPRAFKV